MTKLDYEIESEPVNYGGIWFRSKLEAKWYFFLKQTTEQFQVIYEPCKIGDWTPDFLVDCSRKDDSWVMLLEVKPYHHLNDFEYHHMRRLCRWNTAFLKSEHTEALKAKLAKRTFEPFSEAMVGYCGSSPACFYAPHPCNYWGDFIGCECYWDYAKWPTSKDMGWC